MFDRFGFLRISGLVAVSLLLFVTGLLSGCSGGEAASENTPSPPPTPQPTLDQSIYWDRWRNGPHADTYALEKGPNTYCARCHSPANWDYAATIDAPPNCVSCKFSFEAEPRVAQGNPLVSEEAWADIGCSVCHRMEHGVAQAEIAWYDNATGYYETVADSTELCEKCHTDTEVIRHKRNLAGSAHADFVCTDCHDAHDASASCDDCHTISKTEIPTLLPEHQTVDSNEDCGPCHAGAYSTHTVQIQESGNDDCMDCHGYLMGRASPEPIWIGHSPAHAQVTCVACHDSSGLEVGPAADDEVWVTFRTTELLGRTNREPYQSHTLQRTVDCVRCHFADNPWNLAEITEPAGP